MKKIFILAVSAMLMVSCGMMKNAGDSSQASQPTLKTQSQSQQEAADKQATAFSSGQGAGNALLSLYTQYKADGRYDYTNIQNLMNTMSLVANCEGLKSNFKDTDYLKQFGTGLIASSLGLVTQNNVQTVTNSLVDMVKNSEAVQDAANKAQNAADKTSQYASAISTLLATFSAQ